MAKIPKFKNEKEAAEFWTTHDSTDYLDDMEEDEPIELAPELNKKIKERVKKRLLTIRLEPKQIESAKEIATEKSIPYQVLMRSWIVDGIRKEKAALSNKSEI